MNRFKKHYTIKLVRLNSKKNINLKIPYFTFWLGFFVFFIFFSGLVYVSARNIYTNYQIVDLKKKSTKTKDEIKIYDDFYKKYLTSLEEVKFYIDNSFLVVDNAPNPTLVKGGKGGKGGKESDEKIDIESIKQKNVLNKAAKMNSLPTEAIIASLPNELAYFDDALTLIKNINNNINFQQKESLPYLPFLFPLEKKSIFEINFLNNSAFIKANKDSLIFSTAKGKVLKIRTSPALPNKKDIIIQHNFGIKTKYNNVENLLVKEGQEVEKGEPIAEIKNKQTFIYQIMIGNELVPSSRFMITAK